MKTIRRFFVAGVIPMLCVFSSTLIQYKIIFALGGMVNHTLALNMSVAEKESRTRISSKNISDFKGTCISSDADIELYDSGPFAWSPAVEGGIVSTSLIGTLVGMILSLHIYTYLDARLVYSLSLILAGVLSIVTPFLALIGGPRGDYIIVAVAEFLECGLTALLSPMIPTVVNNWFLPSEHYIMSNIIWLGLDMARICYSLTGVIVDNFGWKLLFYVPGAFSLASGSLYYVFMTQDPADNLFLSAEEKKKIADSKGKSYEAEESISGLEPVYHQILKVVQKFMSDMRIVIAEKFISPIPYKKIFKTKMFWIAMMASTAQSWIMSMMVLMNKDFFEDIHGYSVQEAAMMVTLPNNLFMIPVYLCAGFLADYLIQAGVEKVRIRQIGISVQIISIIPMFVLPFLPCQVMKYREMAVFIQIMSSLRGFGNLSGYSSMGDLSPRYQGTLVSLSSLFSVTVPGLVISFMKGMFGVSQISAWQKNYSINCCIVLFFSSIYFVFVDTNKASWAVSS